MSKKLAKSQVAGHEGDMRTGGPIGVGVVRRLEDGFSTTINLSGAGVTFWEKTVQPPGYDGEEAIATTTMRNTLYRTKAPRSLITVTDGEMSVAYDPTQFDSPESFINVNQEITITFPDEGTYMFWGYVKSFAPEALEEGKEPLARISIVVTNVNASGTETGPVFTAGSGTGG